MANGAVAQVPSISLSQGVAVQIYRLIFDNEARHESLVSIGAHGFYRVLASLEFGVHVELPDQKAADRLRVAMGHGTTQVPGRAGIKAGTVLYKVLWEGWPEELATWEEEDDIPCGEVDFVAQFDAAHEAVEAGETDESGSESGSDDEV